MRFWKKNPDNDGWFGRLADSFDWEADLPDEVDVPTIPRISVDDLKARFPTSMTRLMKNGTPEAEDVFADHKAEIAARAVAPPDEGHTPEPGCCPDWALEEVEWTPEGLKELFERERVIVTECFDATGDDCEDIIVAEGLLAELKTATENVTIDSEYAADYDAEMRSRRGEVRTVSSTGGEKGVKPERHSLIPPYPLAELARHYAKGAEKYSAYNWCKGYEWSKSYDSLQRHAQGFWSGQDFDEDGNSHLAAIAFHAFALIQFSQDHPEFDDRYKKEV